VLNEGGSAEETPFKILTMLFKTMACEPPWTDREVPIDTLNLHGIPALSRPTLLNSPQFKQVMCAARRLTLHFGKWPHHNASRNATPRKDFPSSKHPFDFVASLVGWLSVGKDKREKLDLSFDDYVGYYPKLDLSYVHYPWLKDLSLGGITITHDRQIVWITSHGSTLQTLRLINCPIITQVRTYMEFDKHFYPIPTESAADPTAFNNKKMCWSAVLNCFTDGLTSLRNFQVSFLGPSGKLEDAESGMVNGRYKVYMIGRLTTNDHSSKVDEKHLKSDTQAYIRLLKHTGQWKTPNLAISQEEEKDEEPELDVVTYCADIEESG
jgi:hypothetical protein